MFDTHVNLHGEPFADDLEEVLERAREAGVTRFLAICDRFDNFESVLAIARRGQRLPWPGAQWPPGQPGPPQAANNCNLL